MSQDYIFVKGAREHNLKNIDVRIPRNRLVVITGLSGSGKSSLAFDTIYAEGQRRYVESLSAYARQFLEQLQKPEVEYIEGLSPAISIEQRAAGSNPRSTVGTQTEIHDYLRLLFARIGIPHCHRCGRPITRQSPPEIVDQVMRLPAGTKLQILAPLVRGRKGEYRELLRDIRKSGFVRVRVDGKIHDLSEEIRPDKKKKHNLEAVVDRLVLEEGIRARLTESIETALKLGKGLAMVNDRLFSELYACPECGISYEELNPRNFSFNSPYGACPSCGGLGTRVEVDPELVVREKGRSLSEGVIEPWRRGGGRGAMMYYRALLREVISVYDLDPGTPFSRFSRKDQRLILYGGDRPVWGKPWEGVIPYLERRFRETESDYVREEIHRYMSVLPCHSCHGARLRPESLAVKVAGKSIWDVTRMSVTGAREFFAGLSLSGRESLIAHQVLKEIKKRLEFLLDVGLGYLTMDRRSSTLSGGEAQRIRLATQIGSGLVGVIYILDEPSIGLHPRDNNKLLSSLKTLRDLGNTLIVVEHDAATIKSADYIIDLGPGAGKHGGELVAAGTLAELIRSPRSVTAKYFRGELKIEIPEKRRKTEGRSFLEIVGGREHNLKNVDVRIPLGVFNCVTGVSGSGKSTLVDEILYRALAQKFYRSTEKPGAHDRIKGMEFIDKVVVVDQSPIGRTPRSNPVTYTGAFTPIRQLFSQLPEAKLRGYAPGRFSFNVKGGRCEACQGDGIKKVEMHFLPAVYVPCEVCRGKRYNEQTLEVKYKGKSISDALAMTVEEGLELFRNIPAIRNKLDVLTRVGLGYLEMGQSATTLSGGEAQRVKLSSELSRRGTGRTLYLLDEPTTGLHFADIDKLLRVLMALVDAGNTVLVIEHNLDVIKCADHIIDLGPEGGEAGGRVVACGSPEEVARDEASHTGRYLREILTGASGNDFINLEKRRAK